MQWRTVIFEPTWFVSTISFCFELFRVSIRQTCVERVDLKEKFNLFRLQKTQQTEVVNTFQVSDRVTIIINMYNKIYAHYSDFSGFYAKVLRLSVIRDPRLCDVIFV